MTVPRGPTAESLREDVYSEWQQDMSVYVVVVSGAVVGTGKSVGSVEMDGREIPCAFLICSHIPPSVFRISAFPFTLWYYYLSSLFVCYSSLLDIQMFTVLSHVCPSVYLLICLSICPVYSLSSISRCSLNLCTISPAKPLTSSCPSSFLPARHSNLSIQILIVSLIL